MLIRGSQRGSQRATSENTPMSSTSPVEECVCVGVCVCNPHSPQRLSSAAGGHSGDKSKEARWILTWTLCAEERGRPRGSELLVQRFRLKASGSEVLKLLSVPPSGEQTPGQNPSHAPAPTALVLVLSLMRGDLWCVSAPCWSGQHLFPLLSNTNASTQVPHMHRSILLTVTNNHPKH